MRTELGSRGLWLALGLAAASVGCGGARSPAGAPARGVPTDPAEEPARRPREVPPDTVLRAAMPFIGVEVKGGVQLEARELVERLSDADAICLGERHDNPHDHYAQLAVLDGLFTVARSTGRQLAVGFEMFGRPHQHVLSAWSNDEIDDEELIERSEWHERWGYPFNLYRPLLERSRRGGAELLALNAPRELTRKIARGGLDGLSESERARLPELDLDDAEHKDWFRGTMKHHPGHGDPDNLYAAQVTWDETMAQAAASWLAVREPARQIVVIAGKGHCRSGAIPTRIARRGGARAIGVRAVIASREADPLPELAGFDYGVVLVTD